MDPEFVTYRFSDWFLVSHQPTSLMPRASHSHLDYFSPLLYYKANPVITELGRPTYDESFWESISPHCHINVFSFLPSTPRSVALNPRNSQLTHYHASINSSSFQLIIQYSQHSRSILSYTRSILLTSDYALLTDSLHSKKPMSFDVTYYLTHSIQNFSPVFYSSPLSLEHNPPHLPTNLSLSPVLAYHTYSIPTAVTVFTGSSLASLSPSASLLLRAPK